MAAADPWLVVGLGNPGPEYVGNRHNVGHLVLDVLAGRAGGRFKAHKSRSEVVEARLSGERVVLAKPRSYMNETGGPIVAVRDFFNVPTEQIIVVHDEPDLDYGVPRLQRGGGGNGHNGLRSVTRALGTPDYLRVRFGIGRPPGRQDPAVYVLRDFSAAERKDLDVDLDRAADATEALVTGTLEAAQNAFNG